MKIKQIIHKVKKDRMTFMVIPHSNGKPLTISISSILVYSILSIIFFLIIASSFMISRYMDYINILAHNMVLQNNIEYFSKELIKNRNFLTELKSVDSELRTLLDMKDRNKIVNSNATGGPELLDQIIAQKMSMPKPTFTVAEFNLATKVMQDEVLTELNSSREIITYIKKQKKLERAKPKNWPTRGYISSGYGYRIHPITGRTEFHPGIDISCPRGSIVRATADGIVKYAQWLGGYGQLVAIEHGYGYTTFYGHLSKILVTKSKKVKRGDIIAYTGNTGLSTGPHIHYEVRYNNKTQNPLHFLGRK